MNHSAKCLTVLGCTLFFMITISCSNQPDQNITHGSDQSMEQNDHSGLALIYQMSFMSQYAQKLYLAGVEENWELADIYSHEIEEIAETIINENHVDDGVNVSQLMELMLPQQIEQIEEAIDARDVVQFRERYNTLVQTCNQCHTAAHYGAVKITVPESNPFNQDFSVSE